MLFRLMLDRRVPVRLKLIPIAALAYLVLPHDIIPDIVPALGRIDDVAVILLSVLLFLGMAPKDVVSDNIRGRRGKGGRDGPEGDKPVVDGKYRVISDEEDEEKEERKS